MNRYLIRYQHKREKRNRVSWFDRAKSKEEALKKAETIVNTNEYKLICCKEYNERK